MATAPFHVSPELTAIAIAYRNPVTDYIADLVMPRTRPVGKLEFSYTVYDLSAFNRPNTFVGRKGRPNEVTMSSTTQTAAIEDFGLDDLIPMSDIEQGRAIGRDIQAESVEYIMGLVKLDRECRVAAAAQNAANFTNTATLSGSNQWSHADSKPLTALLGYLDTPMMRPNTMILSAPVWSKLRTADREGHLSDFRRRGRHQTAACGSPRTEKHPYRRELRQQRQKGTGRLAHPGLGQSLHAFVP